MAVSLMAKTTKKPKISEELLASFSTIVDERMNRKKRHSLQNILIIAICSILCGADSWLAIETIGKAKLSWFRKFLWLPHGIPSHDTFARVFVWLDPKALQGILVKWTSELHDLVKGNTIAIDGKKQRRSFDKTLGKSAIHVVTAFACESGIALGLTKVASKSNEITAIPELLDVVDVSGAVVTIDAMGCQTKIAEKIIDKKADYVLALKKNQFNIYLQSKILLDSLKNMQQMPDHTRFHQTENVGHGRHEVRKYWISNRVESIKGIERWKGAKSIGCVESIRTINEKQTVETRYYITSIDLDVQAFARAVRNHWGIENSYHWILDVVFRADDNRMRLGHSPENFAVLQAFALNLLKRETSSKSSVRIKRLVCANNEKYLQRVLSC